MKRFVMLLAAVVSLSSCNLDVANPYAVTDEPSDPTKESFDPSLKVDIGSMTKSPAGAYYRDTREGTGATLTGNTVVVVSYLGFLRNASQFAGISDQTIALDGLVGGMQDAMRGMKVGGERLIVVPSSLGYGSVGTSRVPPNSTLIFDVILKNIP